MLDTFGGRKEMIEYAAAYGLPIKASAEKIYSTDANLLGLTHEAGRLEELETPATLVTPEMGVWPWDAPDETALVSITWEAGRPVAIDGVATPLVEVFRRTNALAGKHGVGIGRHLVENRFVGIKSRGVYEAPGMELLGQAYEYLLQLVLDRRARDLFDVLSRYLAMQIYQGYGFDFGTTAALAASDRFAGVLSGTVGLRLYRGSVVFEGISGLEGKGSLYAGRRLDGARRKLRPHRRRGVPARARCPGPQLRQRTAAPPGAGVGAGRTATRALGFPIRRRPRCPRCRAARIGRRERCARRLYLASV